MCRCLDAHMCRCADAQMQRCEHVQVQSRCRGLEVHVQYVHIVQVHVHAVHVQVQGARCMRCTGCQLLLLLVTPTHVYS
jgi:hypothetical protein